MNKILLIVLLGIVIVILSTRDSCEPFENVCKELQTNTRVQILKYNETLINNENFSKNIDVIIDPFVNLKKIEPEITIEEYLVEKKIPVAQIDKAILLIKSIINNNCLMSALSEYDVSRKSLLKDIVQTFLLDNLRNSLICLISDKKVIELIVQQIILLIIKPYVEICSKEKFMEYCESNYTQTSEQQKDVIPKVVSIPVKSENGQSTNDKINVSNIKQIEQFANELKKTAEEIKSGTMTILDIESKMLPLVSNSPKFMSVESIDNIIKSFNSSSFGADVESYLKELMVIYKSNYNKDINISNKSDFSNFVLLLINEFKQLIDELLRNNICKGDTYTCDEFEQLVNKFNGYKKIYYMLKHYYKIVAVYELINKDIKENDIKLQAMMCCTRQGEKSCHNFSKDINNPSAIIYGFNNYGYVNSVKCVKGTPEAIANVEEQKKTLDAILSSKYEMWKNISRENKAIINGSIINLFKIYGVNLKTIEGNLGDIRKNLRDISNKVSAQDLGKNIKVMESNIINKIQVNNPEYISLLKTIDSSENIDSLKKILLKYGFTNEQIVLNSNVVLDVAKEIVKVIIFCVFLFVNFGYSYNKSPATIVKLMGIMKTKQSFNDIFAETNIVPRYFSLIQQAIMTSITNGKFAIIAKYDMNSIPLDVINYIKSKPTDQSLTLCSVYGLALEKFRKDRIINANEYISIDNKMYMYCNPDKIKLETVKSSNIPLSDSKGLNVLERSHSDYSSFVVEQNKVIQNNMKSEIVSDNILYNFMKNTYN
jgi:hypothetical protein